MEYCNVLSKISQKAKQKTNNWYWIANLVDWAKYCQILQQFCGFLHCFFDFENRQTEILESFDQRCQQHDTEIKETVYPKQEERE